MKTPILAAALLGALAAPAFAGPDCTKGTGAPKPMWQIAQSFEEAGGQIVQMKVSDGCYEIYGTEKDGAVKVEAYYDPRTGTLLEREED